MNKCICPNCRIAEIKWDTDEDAEDLGYIEPGIVEFYHCDECGAQIEVYVPNQKE